MRISYGLLPIPARGIDAAHQDPGQQPASSLPAQLELTSIDIEALQALFADRQNTVPARVVDEPAGDVAPELPTRNSTRWANLTLQPMEATNAPLSRVFLQRTPGQPQSIVCRTGSFRLVALATRGGARRSRPTTWTCRASLSRFLKGRLRSRRVERNGTSNRRPQFSSDG